MSSTRTSPKPRMSSKHKAIPRESTLPDAGRNRARSKGGENSRSRLAIVGVSSITVKNELKAEVMSS